MKLHSSEALAPLISKQIKGGVYTNCPGEPGIGPRGMEALEFEGGLLLFQEKEGLGHLKLYLQRGASLPELSFSAPAVTELVCRRGDARCGEVAQMLTEQGFRLILSRVCLSRKGEAPKGSGPVFRAEPGQREAVNALLRESFSPISGCLPTAAELERDIAAGNVLCAAEKGELCGVLRMDISGKVGEILHLAVAPEHSGKGLAGELVAEFLRLCGGRARVWTGEDNSAARRVYEKAGFAPEGKTSLVLYREY